MVWPCAYVYLTCFYIPSSECLYSAVEWCTAAEKMILMTDVPYITLIVKNKKLIYVNLGIVFIKGVCVCEILRPTRCIERCFDTGGDYLV